MLENPSAGLQNALKSFGRTSKSLEHAPARGGMPRSARGAALGVGKRCGNWAEASSLPSILTQSEAKEAKIGRSTPGIPQSWYGIRFALYIIYSTTGVEAESESDSGDSIWEKHFGRKSSLWEKMVGFHPKSILAPSVLGLSVKCWDVEPSNLPVTRTSLPWTLPLFISIKISRGESEGGGGFLYRISLKDRKPLCVDFYDFVSPYRH